MKSKYNAQIKYAKKRGFIKIGFDTDKETRDKFHEACKKNNTTITNVLKKFVNDYIEENEKNKFF